VVGRQPVSSEVTFDSHRGRASWCLIYSILVTALGVTGCTPSKIPLSGKLTLEYSGRAQSNLLFSFENGLSEAVRFRGLSASSTPIYAAICFRASGNAATGILGPPLAAPSRSTTVKVPSGKRVRLTIPGDAFQEFSGGKCRIILTLENGATVESGEFTP
jgi:hypothetical protein